MVARLSRDNSFHFAVKRGLSDRIDVSNYLLDDGVPTSNIMFETSPESCEQEILSGLDTPLHSAAATGRLAVVDLLLSKGADPSIQNSYGKFAVEEAEYYGWSEVVDSLRSLSQ